MFGILVVILILPRGLAVVLFSKRVGEAAVGVPAVGALPLGFQIKLGFVGSMCIPTGPHAAEASFVSFSSLSAFRAAMFGRLGPPECLLPTPLPSLISLMGLLVLILLSILSGLGLA